MLSDAIGKSLPQALRALRREKISTVDTAWLRMDSDANLMMIVSVLMFNQPLDEKRFEKTLADRFLRHSRFRSRVEIDLAGAWWREQKVDLNAHIVHGRLEGKGSCNKTALEHLVGELAATPLSPDRPLWQMHLIDNCIGEDGAVRQAAVIRIHHCIADGIALVGVLLSMFDASPDAVPRDDLPEPDYVVQQEDNPWAELLMPVTRGTIKAINVSTSIWTRYIRILAETDKLASRFSAMGQMTSQLAQDAIGLMAMQSDSQTRLKGKPLGKKHVAWSEPLPLGEIKAIGKALGCSINDVLMASVAGAIGAWLRASGDDVPEDTEIRAMVPVNLRKSGRDQKLGNAFGLVPLVLPVGIEDPMARLLEVRHRMTALKGGYQAMVAMAILGVLGATPRQMQSEIQGYFARKATAVMSNVPGPAAPLYLAGSRLDQIMFWVPQSGDIGVGVSILSYNGGVQFGLVTDDAIAEDPHQIIDRFAPEFDKLVYLALMSEWDTGALSA